MPFKVFVIWVEGVILVLLIETYSCVGVGHVTFFYYGCCQSPSQRKPQELWSKEVNWCFMKPKGLWEKVMS
jgi:hypothetical protein